MSVSILASLGSLVRYLEILSVLKQISNFSSNFCKSVQYQIKKKIGPTGAEPMCLDKGTDITKLESAFHKCTKGS